MDQWILNNMTNIHAFINFQHKPFSRMQCIKNFFVLCVLSVGVCCIGKITPSWCVLLSALCISILTLFLLLIVKYDKAKPARYASDCISFLGGAILLNLACYRFLYVDVGQSNMLILFSFLLPILSLIFWVVSVFKNIKNGSYLKQNNHSGSGCAVLPVMGAVLGTIAIRVFAQHMQHTFIFYFLGVLCALLSFLCYAGVASLLKLYLFWKVTNMNESL